jgi:hypothetical protein
MPKKTPSAVRERGFRLSLGQVPQDQHAWSREILYFDMWPLDGDVPMIGQEYQS